MESSMTHFFSSSSDCNWISMDKGIILVAVEFHEKQVSVHSCSAATLYWHPYCYNYDMGTQTAC